MQYKWLKRLSILVLSLFIFVDSDLMATFSLAHSVEIGIEPQAHDDEPAESNTVEQTTEKSEFILSKAFDLTYPITLEISLFYDFDHPQWMSRCITVPTPPPNLIFTFFA